MNVSQSGTDMSRSQLIITNHAIRRWQQRIENVTEDQAVIAMLAAIQTAKDKHVQQNRIAKNTFYIPTSRAILVGSRKKIVTVLEPRQSPFEFETADADQQTAGEDKT